MKVNGWVLSSLFLAIACSRSSEIQHPKVKPLMEAVYASGFVISKEEYQAFSQVDGVLSMVLADEGNQIKKGDPILIIESNQQNSRYKIAKEAYDLALANSNEKSPVLSEIQFAIASARNKVSFDSLTYLRYANLWKQQATAQAEYDRATLAYETSQNELKLQTSRYQKIKNQLHLDLENAKAQLSIASEESGRYVVRSEIDGNIYKILKEKGELVRRSEAVAIIGGGQGFYLQLTVDEMDIRKVATGQEVLVTLDAFGDEVFSARVTKVYPQVNSREQSLRVDADFVSPLAANFSGLAAEANIVIRKKENALVIKKSYLLPGDTVLVRTANGEKKIKIERGVETLDEVEVLNGLDTASQLIVMK